jgi:hypothetical protein
MGQCTAGTAKPVGTVCVSPDVCRAAGQCNGSGTCEAGLPINEGKSCIGGDICQSSQCLAGQCTPIGPRDCSNGNPCLAKNSCMPGVGCVAVNICDMMAPADMSAMPDLLDLASADLSSVDAAGPVDARKAPDAAQRDMAPQQKDGPSYSDNKYQLPLEINGGACTCQVGRRGTPVPSKFFLLLCVGLLLLRRRRA